MAAECAACGQAFTGDRDFDAHRVGTHAYPFSFDRLDGRRCLDTYEMEDKGWFPDRYGRWSHPRRKASTRFQGSAETLAA